MTAQSRWDPSSAWAKGAAVAGALVTLSVALSACTANAGESSSSESPSGEQAAGSAAVIQEGEAVSGTGPTGFPGVDFPIPEDARSVAIEFECGDGGDWMSVELGDAMMLGQGTLQGACAEAFTFEWPIEAKTSPTLSVMVSDGVEWTATPTFSSAEFAYDAAVSADCAAFSAIYSDLAHADLGVTTYDALDEEEWTVMVDEAAADLEALASSSQSDLADAFGGIAVSIEDPDRRVGQVLTSAVVAIDEVHLACNANHTPLVITSSFGG